MPLFQRTVLKEFVAQQNHDHIQEAYKLFVEHFGNTAIQDNIIANKEEQYQEGFAKDFFVKLLGYTENPKPNYNLTTELKNKKDNRKVDAAILKEGEVLAVIEMKSTKINDLQSIEDQAFRYKNNHAGCKYVITTNFIKIRFYYDDAENFEEFDLFDRETREILSYEKFAVIYMLLHWKNLSRNLPATIKQKSIEREDAITIEFYNDYQDFRDTLFLDFCYKNRNIDKFLLFQKTQKFLDRIVFICFASAKGLLPANLVRIIIGEWETFQKMNENKPLFYFFIKYFGYINNGYENQDIDIFAYNGGLFAPDEVLDKLEVTDNLLMNQTRYLSRHNFDTDVDINVLGHIFEHSLNELEKRREELVKEATEIEQGKAPKNKKTQGQRKVDGIFYTPAYITKYMIEQTIGKLCAEKKQELDWQNLRAENIATYEKWLAELTVLDPACGSGAFLNQALSFLITEYQVIENAKATVENRVPAKPNVHKILENNIFGVDLNEESVAITKLSLWVKTATMRQKLNDLKDNIKVGNSLIDDKTVTEKAFVWEKEFPKVFTPSPLGRAGLGLGFSVVVGNPPYVSANNMDFQQRQYFNQSKNYKTLTGKWDLFIPFMERGLSLLKNNGIFSFIVPYGLLNQPFATDLRKDILDNFSLQSIVDLHTLKVFADATVPTCIPIIHKAKNLFTSIEILDYTKEEIIAKQDNVAKKGKKPKKEYKITFVPHHTIEIDKYLLTENYMFRTEKLDQSFSFLEEMKSNGTELGELFYVSTGAEIHGKESRTDTKLTSGHSKFDVLHEKMTEGFKPYIEGAAIPKSRSVGRYCFPDIDYYLDYDNNFERMRSPKFKELFENPKIMVRRSAGLLGILATYDERKLYCTEKCILITDKNSIPETHRKFQATNLLSLKYVLAIINSKLMNFYYKSVYGGFIDVYPNYLKSLPILATVSPEIEQIIVNKVDKLLLAHQNLSKLNKTFLKVLNSNFGLAKPNEKLSLWYEMEWANFAKEMKKLKSAIAVRKEFEWIDIFEEKKAEAQTYLNQIQTLDNELDRMIYALYDLSEEEIRMVEK